MAKTGRPRATRAGPRATPLYVHSPSPYNRCERPASAECKAPAQREEPGRGEWKKNDREDKMLTNRAHIFGGGAAFGIFFMLAAASGTLAAEAQHYRFGYDQPHTTGYGVAGDIFAAKLAEQSKGTMVIDQFPGAQLGQEPQMLQLVKAGDIDFIISSTANAATVSPESGVMSIHFLFKSEDHLAKAIADPKVVAAVRQMFEETVKGAHVLTVLTLGLRDLYGKREIHKVEDLKGVKVRVQATP